jgi:hypothetical protein
MGMDGTKVMSLRLSEDLAAEMASICRVEVSVSEGIRATIYRHIAARRADKRFSGAPEGATGKGSRGLGTAGRIARAEPRLGVSHRSCRGGSHRGPHWGSLRGSPWGPRRGSYCHFRKVAKMAPDLASRRPLIADIYRGKRTTFFALVGSVAAARARIAPLPSTSPRLC